MARSYDVRTADELMDEELAARWRERQALDPLPRRALAVILGRLVDRAAPVSVDALAAELGGHDRAAVAAAVATLDDKDLIAVRDGRIVLAYPLAAAPTGFTVVLPDGRQRYAVCAIDALGVPAMLGQPVTIRTACHHCQEPLDLRVRPDGPEEGGDVMVWVGERGGLREKAFSSL